MPQPRIVLLLLLALLATAAESAAGNAVDVPDEFGLGERLALVAWLNERKVAIADPNDLAALRAAYLHLTKPAAAPPATEARTTDELERIDQLKTALWVRHHRSITGFPPVAELTELLQRLDTEAAAALAAQQEENDLRNHRGQERQEPAAKPAQPSAPPAQPAASTTTDVEVPDPPHGSWREARSEAGATYRLLYAEVIAPLRKRPSPRPAWYPTAIRYLESSISRIANPMVGAALPNPVPLRTQLEAAGCDDPGVLAIACQYGGACVRQPDPVMVALERGGYALRLRHACAVQVLDHAYKGPMAVQSELFQRYFELCRKLGIELLHSDLRDPRLKGMLARQLRLHHNIFYQHQVGADLLAAYVAEIDQSASQGRPVDPWLAAMICGQSELIQAWTARGNGKASQVTEAGWEGFRRHQEAARIQFEHAWELEPSQPFAATMRIAVAMGMQEGPEQILDWLDRAVSACPDHLPAYSMAQLALSPQWGGSPELQFQVCQRALRTGDYSSPAVHAYLDTCSAPGVRRLAPQEDFRRIERGYRDSPYYCELAGAGGPSTP